MFGVGADKVVRSVYDHTVNNAYHMYFTSCEIGA